MLTPSQLEDRKSGIGASECGVVLGIDPYKTPYELWLEKTNRKEKEDLLNNSAVIMGNMLEPVIAKRYAQLTNEKIVRVNKAYRHKKYPHILCHLDRKIIGKQKAVEIKTANPYANGWGQEGSDEVPLHYIAQIQHQLAVTGWKEADLIVFRGTTDLRIYSFKRDEELINTIIKKIDHFWNHYIYNDIAPPPSNKRDLNLIYPKNNGDYKQITSEISLILQSLETIKNGIDQYHANKVDLERQLIAFIAENDGIINVDKIIATYKANKNGTRILRINQRSQ